ncbi:MAG: hypothetical protein J6F31_09860 [Oscillospiraceae bacterium]|nr:hypothetical protein [Oscillospiraceae bacterium]
MIKFHLGEAPNDISVCCSIMHTVHDHPHLVRDGVEIGSFFGSPPVIWNGGRMMLGKYDAKKAKAEIARYNEMGIPYRFTWTNPLIEEEHLDDYDCNDLLDFADNGLNECIVNSPVLEEYIRKTHPNIKLTSSTCKCIRDIDEVKAELAKPYSLVVLDYNFNNDYESLEELTPEERKRCEILSNPACRPGCTRRKEHYRWIGEQQLHYREYMERYNRMTPEEQMKNRISEWECADRNVFLFGEKEYPLHVKPDDLYNKYVPMGFENFKLEGRASNAILIAEQVTRYMAKPESADEFRYRVNVGSSMNQHLNYGG